MHTYQHFATVLAQLLGNETAVRLTVNGYMPLSVEDIGQSTDGDRLIALCHYGEQQGDLMRDPEMVFEIHTSGLIFQDGEMPIATYHFKHALVQDAAYSTLPKKPRRVLHARIAKALESRFPQRVTMEPELLAYNYEQAGLTGPAVDYWNRAARRDAERWANIEALNHFNRALDVLKDLPQGSECNAMELESSSHAEPPCCP